MSRRAINFAKRIASGVFRASYDRREAVGRLTKLGWKVIGRGAFATALIHEEAPEVVIKVSAAKSGRRHLKTMRDGFPEYVRHLLREGRRSVFAPRIYQFESSGDDRLCITVMERLYRQRACEFTDRARATAVNLAPGGYFREPASAELKGYARQFIESISWIGRLDLHPGNIMKRADGSRVFSDPLIINN